MKKRILVSLLLIVGSIWALVLSAFLMNNVDTVSGLLSVILDMRWLMQFIASLSMIYLGVFISNSKNIKKDK